MLVAVPDMQDWWESLEDGERGQLLAGIKPQLADNVTAALRVGPLP